ncbi:hypothetical protein IC232_07905 [Microvirga sp. BT688]|uniref:hypothetical protein n=1 Tax=Microvirga sp. TaxID=1873136 RepID=UPI00168A3CCF|nr:hypothetical protein [Microvirga sp.]MBD2746624.1 hypothetical protein [Microvirga sp.]
MTRPVSLHASSTAAALAEVTVGSVRVGQATVLASPRRRALAACAPASLAASCGRRE